MQPLQHSSVCDDTTAKRELVSGCSDLWPIVGMVVPLSTVSGRQCRCSAPSPFMSHHLRAESLQFIKNYLFRLLSMSLMKYTKLRRIYCYCCTLNKLDTLTNENYRRLGNFQWLNFCRVIFLLLSTPTKIKCAKN